MRIRHLALTALISLIVPAAMAGPAPAKTHKKAEPLVIAHRGASGYRPEHTLAAYALGARMGADFIEPDLVSTKDGVLVARHENEISATTDVADHPEFAGRRTTKTIDGVALTGWFTEDFTLAELKTLRAKERIPRAAAAQHALQRSLRDPDVPRGSSTSRSGFDVGVYPETKHPTYFRTIGLPLEKPLVRALKRLRRSRVHPVVRGRQPEGARPRDQPAARPAPRRARRPARSASTAPTARWPPPTA